jgi:hypothetical protein
VLAFDVPPFWILDDLLRDVMSERLEELESYMIQRVQDTFEVGRLEVITVLGSGESIFYSQRAAAEPRVAPQKPLIWLGIKGTYRFYGNGKPGMQVAFERDWSSNTLEDRMQRTGDDEYDGKASAGIRGTARAKVRRQFRGTSCPSHRRASVRGKPAMWLLWIRFSATQRQWLNSIRRTSIV